MPFGAWRPPAADDILAFCHTYISGSRHNSNEILNATKFQVSGTRLSMVLLRVLHDATRRWTSYGGRLIRKKPIYWLYFKILFWNSEIQTDPYIGQYPQLYHRVAGPRKCWSSLWNLVAILAEIYLLPVFYAILGAILKFLLVGSSSLASGMPAILQPCFETSVWPFKSTRWLQSSLRYTSLRIFARNPPSWPPSWKAEQDSKQFQLWGPVVTGFPTVYHLPVYSNPFRS